MKPEPSLRKQYLFVVGWIVALLLLALLTPNPANAQTQIEFSVGQTQYGARNGIWWQDDYEHYAYDNHLRGSSQMLSLRVPNWRASLVHMGKATNSAMWGKYELREELAGNYPRCDAGMKNECFYGHGYGDVWGVSLGRVIEHKLGPVLLEGEAGGFLYHATWHEEGTGPDGRWFADTQSAGGASDHGNGDSAETHLTYYLGATAHYGYLFGTFRYYNNVRDGNGLMGQMAKQVMVGVSIPFGGEK